MNERLPVQAAIAAPDDVLDALMSCAPTRAVPIMEELRATPAQAERWLALAEVLDRNGFQGQSALAALHGHAQAPGDPEVTLDTAYILVWNRRDQEALDLVGALLHDAKPEARWTALEVHLAVQVRRAEWSEACVTCETLIELSPETYPERGLAYHDRLPALELAARGEVRGALFELAEEPSMGTPVDAAFFEGLAGALERAGEQLLALWALDEALMERDDLLLARRLDTMAAVLHVNPETAGERCAGEALAWFRRKVVNAPTLVKAWVALAAVSLDLGLVTEAEQAATRALELAPGSTQGRLVRAAVWAEQGRIEEAAEELEAAAKEARRPEFIHVELAQVLRRRAGDLDGAAQACRRALELEPSHVSAWAMLESLCEELRDAEGQLEALTALVALESDDRLLETMYQRQAELLGRLNRPDEAAEARRLALVSRDGDFEDVYDDDEPLGEPPEARSVVAWLVGLVCLVVAVVALVRWASG